MVSWGQLGEKFMPRLYTPNVQSFFENLWQAKGARYLREYIANGAYGILPPGDSYAPDLPIRFVRSAELTPNLDIDLAACPQVAHEYFIPKARARKDDILLAVKGATIGSKKSVAHVREDIGDAIVNGSIFRMHAKDGVSPRLLAIALSSDFAKRQMKLGLAANNGVDYLDKTLIHKLVVPLPAIAQQEELVRKHDVAAENARARSHEADALLSSIDDYLLTELGITLPLEPENTIKSRTQRVPFSDIQQRLDPNFFARKYVDLTEAVTAQPFKLLRDLCDLSTETWDQKSAWVDVFPYLEISAINRTTGQITEIADNPTIEAPSRARMIARPEDILVSTTRPSRGAITLVSRNQEPFVASTGFVVIREVNDNLVDRNFPFHILRSKIGLTQLEQRSSGGNYPAITPSELKRIETPLPARGTQRTIVQEIEVRKNKAMKLRYDAEADLGKAKAKIEAILLEKST